MAHALTPPLAPARLDATQRSGDTDSRAHWALENNMADKSAPINLPFADSFDLVKRVWGMTGLPTVPGPAAMAQFAQRLPQALPSMVTPTFDVNELDKRIADLRAVEQWLNLNVGMLHTTIQSLEVQRNTIATLRSFGGTMLSAAALGAREAAQAASKPQPPARDEPAAEAAAEEEAAPAATRKRRKKSAEAADAGALPFNPVAWWGNLQESFNKVAAAAAEPAAKTGNKTKKPARRSTKRPRKTQASDE
jgi:hypothetical protein